MRIIYMGKNEESYEQIKQQADQQLQLEFINYDQYSSLPDIDSEFANYDFLLLEVDRPYGLAYHIATVAKITFYILTAMPNQDEKDYMLSLGSLDYINLNGGINEICLKLKNFAASQNIVSPIIKIDDFVFNFANYTVSQNDIFVKLSKKQNIILYHLVKNKGKIVTREDLLNEVWGSSSYLETRTIDSHIKAIRSSLHTDCIVTVRGVGYMYLND